MRQSGMCCAHQMLPVLLLYFVCVHVAWPMVFFATVASCMRVCSMGDRSLSPENVRYSSVTCLWYVSAARFVGIEVVTVLQMPSIEIEFVHEEEKHGKGGGQKDDYSKEALFDDSKNEEKR